ncbi:hypothetical protein ACIA5C_41160, partial [Actinoplanes sp. NPDC051343]|uniref:hypothetical protein n=1 Tax=Actinoplanes sp. NPDC051343 TaxID=3363906 RepID=UPI00379345D4
MTTLMEQPAALEMPHEAAPARQRRWPVLVLLAGTALLYLWNLSECLRVLLFGRVQQASGLAFDGSAAVEAADHG